MHTWKGFCRLEIGGALTVRICVCRCRSYDALTVVFLTSVKDDVMRTSWGIPYTWDVWRPDPKNLDIQMKELCYACSADSCTCKSFDAHTGSVVH